MVGTDHNQLYTMRWPSRPVISPLRLTNDLAAYLSFISMIFSVPHATKTVTSTSFSPLADSATIMSESFTSSSVGSPIFTNFGRLRSSLVSPSGVSRLTSPESPSAVRHWYSIRLTKGTDMLCDAGHRSSYFFDVKMSMPMMWHFACPCLPVLDEVTSATLHGCPFNITWEPLRNSPAA